MSAEDVRKLHSKYGIYDECGHSHEEGEPGVVDVENVGLTCEEGLVQYVCYECDTTDGEPTEYTEYGEWPCRTLKELEKP